MLLSSLILFHAQRTVSIVEDRSGTLSVDKKRVVLKISNTGTADIKSWIKIARLGAVGA